MAGPGEAQSGGLVTDVVVAAALLRAGAPEAAMARLLALQRAEDELPLRVRRLLSAARAVAITLRGPAIVRDLTTAHHSEPADELIGLVGLLAWPGPRDG